MSDNFEEIIGEEAEPEAVETEAEEVATEPAEEPKEAEKPEPTVPLSAMIEERSKRQALEMLLNNQPRERQEPQPIPDVFEDQAAYTQHVLQAVQQARVATKMEMSRFLAEEKYGKDVVDEAVSYFNDHPGSEQFLNTPSPFHAAVEYVKRQRVAEEVGADPAAYEAKLREKILQELQAKQADAAIKDAPSLAHETSIGGRQKPPAPNFTPLADILPE